MFDFVNSNNVIISLVISFLALIAAVYAVVYTHMFNRRRIDIDGFYIDSTRPSATELSFSVNNISQRSITLSEISFNCDGKETESIDDHVNKPEFIENPFGQKVLMPVLDSGEPDILEGPTILLPNSHVEFTYYLPPFKRAEIKITCKQRIHLLSKTQTFSVPEQRDQ